MASITLSMIVKNEEKYLQGCLESARPFVDEIVIVDTGSTDSTIEIAKKNGANVFNFAWTGNFSEARNESLRHSTNDWILYLDADERIVDGEQMRKLVRNARAWAYTLHIRGKVNLPSGIVDQVNTYPRLFRRHPRIQFEGVVHEQIMPSIVRLGKTIESSNVVIEHLGYGESVENIIEKGRRNISLLKLQLVKHPNDDYALYQLGNSFVVLKEYDQAEPVLRSVVRSSVLDNSIKSSAYNLLVEVALSKNNVDEAEQFCIDSLKLTKIQTMAKWFLSGIVAHNGKYQEALSLISEIRSNFHRNTNLAHDLVLNEHQIQERELYCYEMLSNEAQLRSDKNETYRWISEAEKKKIFSIPLQRKGLEIALSIGDIPSAFSKLEYLVNNLPEESVKQREKLMELQNKLSKMVLL